MRHHGDNRILLVLGARYDYIKNDGTFNRITRVQSKGGTTTNVVTKYAVVVKPFENRGISFFGNYSETFEPKFGELIVGSGIPFKNLEGESKEIGLKLELLDSRFIATAAYFTTDLKNNAVFDINPNTGLNEFTQGGISPSSGWDLDFTWMINDNWAALVGLADVDSTDFTGKRLRAAQNEFNYKALVRYSASPGRFAGLNAGAGVNYVSERSGDTSNTFFEPGFQTWDAFVSYTRGRLRYQLNVNNITDEVSNSGLIFQSLLFANNPLETRFTVDYSF